MFLRAFFILFQGPELPFQLNAFTMMTNGLNGFLTIGGWSPTRSERLNEIWEMVCDGEVNLSFYFKFIRGSLARSAKMEPTKMELSTRTGLM